MRFVDAHVHLSDEEYAGCVDEVISESRKANVVAIVSNSVDLKTCRESLRLAEKYSGLVYAALGIHPWNVQTITEEEKQQTISLIEEQRNNKALVAIGEIGLDSKYMDVWDKQMKVFDEMLHLAEKLDLPVVVHSRGTTAQIVDMLPSYRLKKVLLHWFSNPISALDKAVTNGYCITEGPPTAYSNGIQDVVRKVPLTNLMTETDGPVHYFRKPFEGKRTTPAYIPVVVKAIAQIKQFPEIEVSEQILKNFQVFFSTETAQLS
jgi:TatD DNase family protein